MRLAQAQILTIAAMCSCDPYTDYLYSLPVVERTHNGEAIAIVAEIYGIDYRIPEVRWVVQDTPIMSWDDTGELLGVTEACVSWVLWPTSYGLNPKDSFVFGHTVMAHELAHCALWLYRGDGDGDHSDVEWWGAKTEAAQGGLVAVARDELVRRGL